jgi:protein TonB
MPGELEKASQFDPSRVRVGRVRGLTKNKSMIMEQVTGCFSCPSGRIPKGTGHTWGVAGMASGIMHLLLLFSILFWPMGHELLSPLEKEEREWEVVGEWEVGEAQEAQEAQETQEKQEAQEIQEIQETQEARSKTETVLPETESSAVQIVLATEVAESEPVVVSSLPEKDTTLSPPSSPAPVASPPVSAPASASASVPVSLRSPRREVSGRGRVASSTGRKEKSEGRGEHFSPSEAEGDSRDQPPRALPGNPFPPYPPSARRMGREGIAVIRIHVGTDGQAGTVLLHSSSGNGVLDQAALEAARRWRFVPALRKGVPVQATVDVPFAFRLVVGFFWGGAGFLQRRSA